MSGERSVPGETPDDSPWRRDSDAIFEHREARPFLAAGDERGADSGASAIGVSTARDVGAAEVDRSEAPGNDLRPRRGGLAWMAAVIVASLVLVSVVWTRTRSDLTAAFARVDVGGFEFPSEPVPAGPRNDVGSNISPGVRRSDIVIAPGDLPLMVVQREVCLSPRLPTTIGLRWSTELPGVRRVRTPVTVGDRTVVLIAGVDAPEAGSEEPIALYALDVESGAVRWSVGLALDSEAEQLLGVVDGTVIVEQFLDDRATHQLVGLDEMSGDRLWERSFDAPWAASLDRESGLIVVDVEGSSNPNDNDVGMTHVIDAATGESDVSMNGRLVSVEPGPVLVTLAGSKVLGQQRGVDGVWENLGLLGAVDLAPQPFAVVGDTFITTTDGSTLAARGRDAEPATATTPVAWTSWDDAIAAPEQIDDLVPLGGNGVAVGGSGSVYGLLVSTRPNVYWRVRGQVVSSVPSDRGRLLWVSSDGGAVDQVVDSSTGQRIVELPLGPGSTGTFAMHANGVVLLDRLERVAVDLDGQVLWTVPGSGPLAIGDRTLVQIEAPSDPGGPGAAPIRVLAYGDDISEPASCGAVVAPGDDAASN